MKNRESKNLKGCLDSRAQINVCPKEYLKFAYKTEDMKSGYTMQIKLPDGTKCSLLKKELFNLSVSYEGVSKEIEVHCWAIKSPEREEILIGENTLKHHDLLPEQHLLVREYKIFNVRKVTYTDASCDSNSFSEIFEGQEEDREEHGESVSSAQVEPEEESQCTKLSTIDCTKNITKGTKNEIRSEKTIKKKKEKRNKRKQNKYVKK